MRLTFSRILACSVAALTLSGCATALSGSLADAMVGDTPKHIRAPASDQDLADVAYVARYLLPQNGRDLLLAVQEKRGYRVKPDGMGMVGGVGVVAAMGGNPLSPGGAASAAKASAALGVLGAIGPDGSMPQIGQANLPAVAEGQELASADDANAFMQRYVEARLVEWGGATNRAVRCINGCEGLVRTFELRRRGPATLKYHDPEVLYFNVIFRNDFTDAAQDPQRDRLLGFTSRWSSASPNSVSIMMTPGDGIKTRPDGSLPEVQNKTLGMIPDIRYKSFFAQPIERELLRTLTKDGFYTFGSTIAGKNLIAAHGRIFKLSGLSASNFVDYELARETDTPYL